MPKTPTMLPELEIYTRAEAARRLGLSEGTLKRYAVEGRGPRFSRTGDVRGKTIYSATDLAQRVLYVEASRGCPFKCAFCLSALEKTAWAFALEPFWAELDALIARGARSFKFVDRTFNLKVDVSVRILQFFLDRLQASPQVRMFLHFELVPDHLPDALKNLLVRFPEGTLQFEIGIQSFNVDVQKTISRRQDDAKT